MTEAPQKFYDWLCFPDYYDGYAVTKARQWWKRRTDEPFPGTVEEALFLSDTLIKPIRILVREDGKYAKIIDYHFAETGDVPVDELMKDYDEVPF